jgi:hypothetical protein
MTTNLAITLADPDGSNYEALELQLIEPWDAFYGPAADEVEGFDIEWRPTGTTTLRVRIEAAVRGLGPIDIDVVLVDVDGVTFTALDTQLLAPWDANHALLGATVEGFTIEHEGAVTRLTVHVA